MSSEKKYWLDQKTSHAMRKCYKTKLWVTSRRNPQQKKIVGTISSIVCVYYFINVSQSQINQGYTKKICRYVVGFVWPRN